MYVPTLCQRHLSGSAWVDRAKVVKSFDMSKKKGFQ